MEIFPFVGAFAVVAGIIVWMVRSLVRISHKTTVFESWSLAK